MLKKLGEFFGECIAIVKAHFMVARAKRMVKSFTSFDDYILAGDIVLSYNIKDEVLKETSLKLHRRVNRLYYLLSLYDRTDSRPPKIIIDKEVELINKAIDEIQVRTEAKSGLSS